MSGFGTTEILLILLVVVLLFGAKKLPELARGSGRALRIFKAETKGLMDDDDDDKVKTDEQRQIDSMRVDNGTYDPATGTTYPTTQPQSSQPTVRPASENDR